MWEEFLSVLVHLVILIHSFIYGLVDNLFQVFIAISSARIFSADDYQTIANNVYIVIGVASLFFVAYGLLQAVVDPDNAGKNDKNAKGIVKNLLIAIVLIAFVPTIFNFAFNVQEAVIRGNVIGKVILNQSSETPEENEQYSRTGATLANEIFIYFFMPVDDSGEPKCLSNNGDDFKNCLNEVESEDGEKLGDVYDEVNGSGKFNKYNQFAENTVGDEKTIEFNWILQFGVGAFLVYVFASFCIDMGLRTVKLAYYQVIAPIPILTLIIPGQRKIFDNWKKNSISTYLEVFIRIVVVFFVLFLIKHLPSLNDSVWSQSMMGTPSAGVKVFAKVFIIVGLLMFMKQAPKLFSDIFGISSGSFKLGIGEKLKEATDFSKVPVIGRAQGAVTGAAGGAWTAAWNPGGNFKKGLKTGLWRGLDAKGNQFNNQRQQFYSKNMDGEGTAGIFGKRNWLEQKVAKTSKEAKNAYRVGNFERVLKFQQSKEWQDFYDKSYNNVITTLNDNITNVKNRITAEEGAYDTAENNIKQKITAAKQNREELDVAKQSFANLSNMFETRKKSQMASIQKEYDAAVAKKDISAQLDAQKRLNELSATNYHNPALENKISELSARNTDVEALESQLSQIQLQRKNDTNLDALGSSLNEYQKQLEKVNKEHEYITSGELEIDNKMVKRSYKTEEEFVKRYGNFTDAVSKADAEMFKANPEYKDVDSSHKKWLMETGVTQFVNSEEGQKAIAVRELAEKNLQSKSGGGSGSGSGDKK